MLINNLKYILSRNIPNLKMINFWAIINYFLVLPLNARRILAPY